MCRYNSPRRMKHKAMGSKAKNETPASASRRAGASFEGFLVGGKSTFFSRRHFWSQCLVLPWFPSRLCVHSWKNEKTRPVVIGPFKTNTGNPEKKTYSCQQMEAYSLNCSPVLREPPTFPRPWAIFAKKQDPCTEWEKSSSNIRSKLAPYGPIKVSP